MISLVKYPPAFAGAGSVGIRDMAGSGRTALMLVRR